MSIWGSAVFQTFLTQDCDWLKYDDPDENGKRIPAAGYPRTIKCSFSREQKQVRLPDGTFVICTGQLVVSGEHDVSPGDGITIDALTYGVLTFQEKRGLFGEQRLLTVYLA